ncbi:MAG: ferrous iron transport protein A [Planctomycetales bacterium]|nr:ferrous iron transport protein A [Planctomycetales bacterium]
MIASPKISGTPLPLDLMQANETGEVVELCGNECQIHRLSEMGLRVGAEVRMVCPGSPCLLALGGKRMSVRLNAEVEVLVCARAAS